MNAALWETSCAVAREGTLAPMGHENFRQNATRGISGAKKEHVA
jgi:hypothetical protein